MSIRLPHSTMINLSVSLSTTSHLVKYFFHMTLYTNLAGLRCLAGPTHISASHAESHYASSCHALPHYSSVTCIIVTRLAAPLLAPPYSAPPHDWWVTPLSAQSHHTMFPITPHRCPPHRCPTHHGLPHRCPPHSCPLHCCPPPRCPPNRCPQHR